jgi:hypothetical protein
MMSSMMQWRAAIVIGVAVAALAGCDQVETDWRRARQENTEKAYKQFIAEHGDSEKVLDARNAIEDLAWEAARDKGTRESLEGYIKQYATGRYVKTAREAIDTLDWQAAVKANSVEGWQKYLTDHKDGKNADKAAAKIDDLQWEEVMKDASVQSLAKFIKDHPNSTRLQQAWALMRDMSGTVKRTMHRAIAGKAGPDGWFKATSTGGGFTVSFPAVFNDFQIDSANPEGVPLATHTMTASTTDKATYTATGQRRLDGSLPAPDALTTWASDLKKRTKVTAQREMTVAGVKAIDVKVTRTLDAARMRAFMIGDTSYTLMVEYPITADTPRLQSLIDKFFDSFQPPPERSGTTADLKP